MKKYLLATILCIFLSGVADAAPPDEDIIITENDALEIETLKAPDTYEHGTKNRYYIKNFEKKIQKLEKKYKGIGSVLENIGSGYQIEELILNDDSVFLKMDNDSAFVFRYAETPDEDFGSGNDIIRVGNTITIDEDETIEGDVISVFGDVIVKGTVEGEVNAFSGDVYITSTGYVANGVMAISGKIKREPGSRIGSVTFSTHKSSADSDDDRAVFRNMGLVFLIIFVIWVILTATCASLMRTNLERIELYIKNNGVFTTFFWGYLIYFLGFLAFIALIITIIGIPLALLGLPLAFFAGTVLASTAISNLIGKKVLHTSAPTFKTFLYGSLYLGLLPGLLFFFQAITGSLVIMIFSWIVIGIFMFIIFPVGLGAVFKTRFGYREENEISETPLSK